MKAGDLVRLKNILEARNTHTHLPSGSIGLVIQYDGPPPKSRPVNFGGDGGEVRVIWRGCTDWDIEYEDELEVVSEA